MKSGAGELQLRNARSSINATQSDFMRSQCERKLHTAIHNELNYIKNKCCPPRMRCKDLFRMTAKQRLSDFGSCCSIRHSGLSALNRFAIGAFVASVELSRDLLRGFWCRVCAVGRGDFASIDRGFPHEHSAFHTDDTPSCPHDRRYVRPQSWACITNQSLARLQAVRGHAYRASFAGHISLAQLKVMSAIERCRTAALGGHVARCEDCAHENRKDRCQLPKFLGVGGEQELAIYTLWASKHKTSMASFDLWLRPADHPPKFRQQASAKWNLPR